MKALGKLLSIFLVAFTLNNSRGQGLEFKGEWVFTAENATYGLVAAKDNYVYTIISGNTLRIFNVSDPASPTITGETNLFTGNLLAAGIAQSGNYVYVLRNGTGFYRRLFIVDVSDPAHPTLAGQHDLYGAYNIPPPLKFEVKDGIAYFPNALGLAMYNVTNPSSITQLGVFSLDGRHGFDVEIQNGLAYIGMGATNGATSFHSAGLQIADITDPAHPWRVGGINGFEPRITVLQGNYVFLANGFATKAFNISNPVSPIAASPDIQPGGTSVASAATHLFFARGDIGVSVLDISNPSFPVSVKTNDTLAIARDIAILGTRAYVADDIGGLLIYDIQNPANPVEIGKYLNLISLPGDKVITVEGSLGFVRDVYNGIRIFDLSNPMQPINVSLYKMSDGVGPAVALGNRGYFSANGGFDIVDLTIPAAPSKIGGYRSNHTTTPDLAVAGGYIYTSFGEVVNVSNPAAPQLIHENFAPLLRGEFLEIAGTRLYIAGFTVNGNLPEFQVYDLSNPDVPQFLGKYAGFGVFAVSGYYVYKIESGYITILNVAIPSDIKRIATQKIGGYLDVSDGMLFHIRNNTWPDSVLTMEDLSVPIAPVVADAETLSGLGPRGIAAAANRVYVIANDGALKTYLKVYEGTLGPSPNLPVLTAFSSSGKVILRWSTDFPTVKLYSTPELGEPWQLVTSSPYQEGSSFTFTNTRPIGNAMFYRLAP